MLPLYLFMLQTKLYGNMKYLISIALIGLLFGSCQNKISEQSAITQVSQEDKAKILAQMDASRQCWNKGDFEGYMKVYWQSDSLTFMGLNSITKGWHSTLRNYKKGYPTQQHRGILSYSFHHFNQLASDCILVVGSFHLEREVGNAEGNFSLIWKKINGEWRIILDHT